MNARDEAALIEAVPMPALAVGPDERVRVMNRAAAGLFGPALAGRHVAMGLRSPELLAAITEALIDGTARDVRLRLPRDGQDTIWVAHVAPLTLGVLCTLRDVSAEEQAEAMRRDFVANVSHELRTPLTAMIGFIETLRTTARDDPSARARFLGVMEREAGRMNRLVQDLLQLSRVEAQERVRPREEVDLAQILATVAATVRQTAEARGSRIVLVGADAPATARGDADQLVQVFLNLFENAIKYGARDQDVTVTLAREMTARGPAVRVDVADRGEGIAPEHLPRLTERFYRIDSHRSRAEGGTGLGLAIVKHIVQRHRGWLRIDSRKGEGSTFSVVLPEA